jgi:hypothetical protein
MYCKFSGSRFGVNPSHKRFELKSWRTSGIQYKLNMLTNICLNNIAFFGYVYSVIYLMEYIFIFKTY